MTPEQIQEQAEKLYPSPNHPTGYAYQTGQVVEMERNAFKKALEWMQERENEAPTYFQIATVFQQIINRDIVHLDDFVKAIRELLETSPPKD